MSWLQPNPFEQQLFQDTLERWPEIMDLARMLCLSTRIESLLLRNARLKFVPQTGAEIESLLWFSPLVAARGSGHIVFHPGAARLLADRLAQSPRPPEIDDVWEYTRLATRHWQPEDRLERDLRYYALRGRKDKLGKGLRDIFRRIKTETGEEERITLARWVKRSLPVINGPGMQLEESVLLAQYASLALGDSGTWGQLGHPRALPNWLAAKLPAPLEHAQLGVDMHADAGHQVLSFTAPEKSANRLTFPTPLPADIYVAQEGQEGKWYTVGADSRIKVPTPSSRLTLVTRDGRQYTLRVETFTESSPGDSQEKPPATLYLCHVEADRSQAQRIQAWLRKKNIDIELLRESGLPKDSQEDRKIRMIRLWTGNARKFWEDKKIPQEIESKNSFILRTDSSEPPLSGTGTSSRVFEWSNWDRFEESSEAEKFLNQLYKWLEHQVEPAPIPPPPTTPPPGAGIFEWNSDDPSRGWNRGKWSGEATIPPGPLASTTNKNATAHYDTAANTAESDEPVKPETENEIARLLKEIENSATEPPRRLAIGDRLAELGDPKHGVGVREIEFPLARELPKRPSRAEFSAEIQAFLDEIDNIETEPPQRLEIGDELARLGDPRKGVGLDENGLPDVDWVEIPGGSLIYQEGQRLELPAFYIARYPVTNAQFQAFVDAGGYAPFRQKRSIKQLFGFGERTQQDWWRNLIKPEPEASRWSEPNRPKTNVNWYEAVAFCRWLSVISGFEIRLPDEREWEKAARGQEGLVYPWGNEYRSGFANINEQWLKAGPWNLGQTTAAGMYPQGASPYGVEDLSGNVWEWCLDKYDHSDETTPDTSGNRRVLRGGSWVDSSDVARSGYRYRNNPGGRYDDWGFRVLSSLPIR